MNCHQYVAECFDEQAMEAKYHRTFPKTAGGDYTDPSDLLHDTNIFDDKTDEYESGAYTPRCGDVWYRVSHCAWATGDGDRVAQYGWSPALLPDANLIATFQGTIGRRIEKLQSDGTLQRTLDQLLRDGKLSDAAVPPTSNGPLTDPTNKGDLARHKRLMTKLRTLKTALDLTDGDLENYERAWQAITTAHESTNVLSINEAPIDALKKNRSANDSDYRLFSPKDRNILKTSKCCVRVSLYWGTLPGLDRSNHFVHIKLVPDGAHHETGFQLRWLDANGRQEKKSEATVFYRGGHRAYLDLLKNGFRSDLWIKAGDPDAMMAEAQRQVGLEIVTAPA
jgi:hypothetical protein